MKILTKSCQTIIGVVLLLSNTLAISQSFQIAQERLHQENGGVSTAELQHGKCMPGNQVVWCYDQTPCLCPIFLKDSATVPECQRPTDSSAQPKLCPGEVCRCLVQPGFSVAFPECVPAFDERFRPGFCVADNPSGQPGGACQCIPIHPIY